MTVAECWPVRDPIAFWAFMRGHHDNKALSGKTDNPDLHEELSENAQRHLTWHEGKR